MEAREWPIDSNLTLIINGAGGNYTTNATITQNPWNPGDPKDILASFDLQGYDLQPGDILTVTGGMTTKVLQVGSVAVTSIEPVADTLSGTAEPGAQLHVWACDNTHCANRNPTANINGIWTVNFFEIEPNGDGSTFDLVPGTKGGVRQYDDDADMTQADWWLPVYGTVHGFVLADDQPVAGASVWLGEFLGINLQSVTRLVPDPLVHLNLIIFKLGTAWLFYQRLGVMGWARATIGIYSIRRENRLWNSIGITKILA